MRGIVIEQLDQINSSLGGRNMINIRRRQRGWKHGGKWILIWELNGMTGKWKLDTDSMMKLKKNRNERIEEYVKRRWKGDNFHLFKKFRCNKLVAFIKGWTWLLSSDNRGCISWNSASTWEPAACEWILFLNNQWSDAHYNFIINKSAL